MKKKVELKKTVKNILTKELTDEELLRISGGGSIIEGMKKIIKSKGKIF